MPRKTFNTSERSKMEYFFSKHANSQITKEGVKDWLESLPPETTFKVQNDKDCPLGRYVQSEGLGEFFQYDIEATKGLALSTCPYWTTKFAILVDREPGPEITVRRALEILEAL